MKLQFLFNFVNCNNARNGNGDISCELPEIEFDDIQEEINFLEPSIVCYIFGANLPILVVKGFFKRIWGKYGLDKVASLVKDFSL